MKNGETYTPLGALSSIRTGQTFKRAWDQYPPGDIAVFLPRDIADEQLDTAHMIKISADEIPALDKHLLKEGDIMMVNKGIRLNHFLYRGNPGQAVATTAFYIITTNHNLLPGFLNWYLGQQEAKNYFALNARGTTISGISKAVLEQLPVPVVPLSVQEYIVRVAKAAQEEQALTNQLLLQKQAFTDSFLWEQINKHVK
ncbi:restriction endonuclease subunit S [Niabella hibiscisoli]|uniref:restriction endonuclease subunit S n=1 Tax=Niabella hibiscisoli TaxID=1825928 RepID=UPI001F0F7E8C|nr:restriction endonuclease subunit S [Niabella hibiscisoli]MCH5719896.1 restriction endonuclease subunit S [Niabella hibiscisoli]